MAEGREAQEGKTAQAVMASMGGGKHAQAEWSRHASEGDAVEPNTQA